MLENFFAQNIDRSVYLVLIKALKDKVENGFLTILLLYVMEIPPEDSMAFENKSFGKLLT